MHTLYRTLSVTVVLSFLSLPGLADSDAAEEELPIGTVNCIRIESIRNTRIHDDSTILFYMAGGKAYVNNLPHRCPGLRMAGSFAYKTSTRSLCNVDTITVIRTGMGGMQGPRCGLGMFKPITPEEIDLLRGELEPDTESEEVMPEIQPPGGAEEDETTPE